MITGPLTFLYLAKPSDDAPSGFHPIERLGDLVAVYAELLGKLADAGAEWVQIDEPVLVADIDADRAEVLANAATVYAGFSGLASRPKVLVAAPYNSLDDALPVLTAAGVDAIAIDLVRGGIPAADLTGVQIVAGVVDGHNIWRTDLDAALAKADAVAARGAVVSIGTSTSLFHVPHTLQGEEHLGAELISWLAFADEKVAEVSTLAKARAGSDEYRRTGRRSHGSRRSARLTRAPTARTCAPRSTQ